jgi:group I intron endonuclease
MSGVIYSITNKENGKKYIGSTINYGRRVGQHKRDLRDGSHHNSRLLADWKKYGEESFCFEIIVFVDDLNRLENDEIDFIYAMNTSEPSKGYNICLLPRSRLGVKCSEETKRRIGNANRGKVRSPEFRAAISARSKGVKRGPCPAETRKKISDAQKGKPRAKWTDEMREKLRESRQKGQKSREKRGSLSDAHKAAISASLTGKKRAPFSEDHKANISKSLRGRNITDKHKARISESMTGNKYTLGNRLSEDHKSKISASLKGRPKTEEHLENLRQAALRRWEKRHQVVESAAGSVR